MSKPPIVVQGTHVASPYGESNAASSPDPLQVEATSSAAFSKGEKQETKCRDPIFAVLLYINLAAIIAVAAIYGPSAFEEPTNSGFTYTGYMWAVLICGACSLVFSFCMMWVMMRIPETLIKSALIFSVAMSAVWAAVGFAAGNIVMGIFGLIFFAIGVCYACAVWKRIPFATANLVTSSTAIKNNCGITMVALIFGILAFGWSILWGISFAGVYNQTYNCTEDNFGNRTCSDPNYGLLFLLFLAYFFMHQVIMNCVHATVAGVVGTWWFSPEESQSCCSPAVRDSFCRTMTTSFGSICFGSLLVAIIEALRALATTARSQGDDSILLCLAECILNCIASLIEYFNKWAFIYVGLYGYSYIEAGKNVFTLFKNRGWDAIVADDLVGNTIALVSVIVGALSGCIGLIIEATSDIFKDAAGNKQAVAFILGFIVGLVLCSILLGTISSGVNAVIVLFAEAPAEFQQNYPDLSEQMRSAYSSAYPGSV